MRWRDNRAALTVTVVVCALAVSGCRREHAPAPDPANELPFGGIEAPGADETVGRMVDVIGWALDDEGVQSVRVYVDGKYHVSCELTGARPDIEKTYPRYARPGAKHGWHALVDLGSTAGRHDVLAQAVDSRGATRDIGTVTVNLIGR